MTAPTLFSDADTPALTTPIGRTLTLLDGHRLLAGQVVQLGRRMVRTVDRLDIELRNEAGAMRIAQELAALDREAGALRALAAATERTINDHRRREPLRGAR